MLEVCALARKLVAHKINQVGLSMAQVEAGKGWLFLPRGRADGEAVHDVIKVNRNDAPTGVAISVRDTGGLDALGDEADAEVARYNDTVLRDEELAAYFGAFAEMVRQLLIVAPARAERYDLRGSYGGKFADFVFFHFWGSPFVRKNLISKRIFVLMCTLYQTKR